MVEQNPNKLSIEISKQTRLAKTQLFPTFFNSFIAPADVEGHDYWKLSSKNPLPLSWLSFDIIKL